jgi:hypothetical protein
VTIAPVSDRGRCGTPLSFTMPVGAVATGVGTSGPRANLHATCDREIASATDAQTDEGLFRLGATTHVANHDRQATMR